MTAAAEGTCPVEGCPRDPQPGHLMCRTDWGHVSKPTQQLVYSTWRSYSRAARSGADDIAERRQAYETAREAAIREAEA